MGRHTSGKSLGLSMGVQRCFARSGAARLGFAGGALLSLLEAIAFAFEGDDLGAVQQPIDERDDAGGVGEDLVPFAEGFVGGEENGALLLVAAGDHLEEQIGVACVVGEIADLVDGEQRVARCSGAAGARARRWSPGRRDRAACRRRG